MLCMYTLSGGKFLTVCLVLQNKDLIQEVLSGGCVPVQYHTQWDLQVECHRTHWRGRGGRGGGGGGEER